MDENHIVSDIENEENKNEINEIYEINNEAEALAREKKQKTIRTCALAAVALTVLSAALRTLSLFFFYEKDIAYYERGAVLPIISNLVYVGAVLFFLVSAFAFIPRAQESDGTNIAPPSFACRMAALLPAAALIYYAASSYLKYGNGEPNGFELVTVVLSVVAAVFFVLFSQKPRSMRFTAMMGLSFVAWAAFVWIGSYIDYTVPLNSPDKLYFHFACIAAGFLVINEIRVLIFCARPREYFFSIAFAILALATSAIPSIIAGSRGVFWRYPAFEADIVLLTILVYTLFRLWDALPQLLAKPTALPEEASGTKESAEAENVETAEEAKETDIPKENSED